MKLLSPKDLDFIKKKFGDKTDKSGAPLWRHAETAREYLGINISKYEEVPEDEIDDLLLGALGHDLLEDTETTSAEIEQLWGKKVLQYIEGMTNTKGDNDFDSYIEHLGAADEEIILIKLADILSNSNNSVERFTYLLPNWIDLFWLPLLERYRTTFFKREYKKYPQTAGAMINKIEENMKILRTLLSRVKPE